MTNLDKHPLHPLMKDVKARFDKWAEEQNLTDGDKIRPITHKYHNRPRKDGHDLRVAIRFCEAEPAVLAEDVKAFAQHLTEDETFTGTAVYRELTEKEQASGKAPTRYIVVSAGKAEEEDEASAEPAPVVIPTLAAPPRLPFPPLPSVA